jgi:FKBP-type peptidyl-prolyl cis-trans isomerase FklB
MKSMLMTVFIIVLGVSLSLAGEEQGFHKKKDQVSYSLGYQIGTDFKKEKMDLDADAFLKGVNDALAQNKPVIEHKEMKTLLSDMKKKIVSRENAEKVEIVEKRLGGGKKFLEENAKKEGVITLESGLQYRVIREGTGKKPKPTDKVKVSYKGTFIDGREFSNSFRKGGPQIFYVNGVVRGISEALQLMNVGAEWEIVVPPEMGFSKRSELGYRTLIYDLELISIEPEDNKESK